MLPVGGASYNLYHYRGVTTASVEFEVPTLPMVDLKDRFFVASLCLMRAANRRGRPQCPGDDLLEALFLDTPPSLLSERQERNLSDRSA